MEFIESKVFTKRVEKLIGFSKYKEIQQEIVDELKMGDEIKKKTYKRRFAAKGHGKRGGCRIIYWHSRNESFVHMLFIFAKNEQDNLTHDQDQYLNSIVKKLEEAYDG
ncbi:MAG: type II toxin-antitoxin system RelE/ParE family toxin [Planctomycetes bacterium]|nr:type II toxin-antitoxin system RelE/ParE family toxin [Planctomycetota bacterium]